MIPRPENERRQLRAKTLALMMNPPRPVVIRPRGHREWMTPCAVRRIEQ